MSSAQSFKFQGSQIAVMTGFAGASPLAAITAITAASPPVVTSTAHGLSDGNVVTIAGVVGMTEVNGGVFIVEELTANTFSLLGVDATGYAAYVSGGTFDVATLSNWCEITGYNRTGGTSPEIPTTTICSNAREFVLGLPDFGTTVIDYLFAPQTPIQIAVQEFYVSGDIMAVRVVPAGKRRHDGAAWLRPADQRASSRRRTMDRLDDDPQYRRA